eukprot:scaffold212039_cov23-Prasinocladus_malaysianus.AAC.1
MGDRVAPAAAVLLKDGDLAVAVEGLPLTSAWGFDTMYMAGICVGTSCLPVPSLLQYKYCGRMNYNMAKQILTL